MGGILQVDTIQNNNASNLITQTNVTTITIGASGQTISIPAGATLNTTTVVLAAGAVGTPSLTTSGDTNTGIFFPAADTIGFVEGGTEVMRIDSDGDVGINTTSPETKLHVKWTSDTVSPIIIQPLSANGTNLISERYFNNESQLNIGLIYSSGASFFGSLIKPSTTSSSDATGYLSSQNQYSSKRAGIVVDGSSGVIKFLNTDTSATVTVGTAVAMSERMRIESAGTVLVGTTSDFSISSSSAIGVKASADGALVTFRDGFTPLFVGRQTSDGTLVSLRQAGVEEGTISVSGATVSYNGFTGSHWSRFIDESKPDVLRGTVMESLDQMVNWYAVEFTDSENNLQKKPYALKANEKEGDVITYNFEGTDYQATIIKQVDVKHVMSKISDTSEAKNVYGVFSAWDNDDLINNDFYVASVGSYVVRIKAGQVVAKGDLLQSNGDGTAKVQADDIIRASTFAKVLSNTVIQTYEDGSFIVPCSLMC